MGYLSGSFAYLTDQGKVRKTNEDCALGVVNAYGNVLLVVADGMGGANKGEYASTTLTNTLIKEFQDYDKEFVTFKQISSWLNKSISKANEKIYKKAQKDQEYKGMGTTLSLCLISKELLVTAQVGDSRIYLIKDSKLTQISVDQTYVQYLSHNNKLSQEEISSHKDRHKLTNALGTKKVANVDINEHVYNHEKILLCSDGLYNNVSPSIIESILLGNDSPEKKCRQLIAFGNASGGTDNMAAVIWECND